MIINQNTSGGTPVITSETLVLNMDDGYVNLHATATLTKTGRTLFVDCFPVLSASYGRGAGSAYQGHGWSLDNGTNDISYSLDGQTLAITAYSFPNYRKDNFGYAYFYPTKVTVYYID